MNAFAFLRRRWHWMLPLVALVPAALFSAQLFGVYFRHFELPSLASAKSGMTNGPCKEHKSAMPTRAPTVCELAQTSIKASGVIRESFYFDDGSLFVLESNDGHWMSSAASCPAPQSWVSLAGMFFLAIAVLAHSIRTGQFFHFPGLKRNPMNDFETIAAIYGACLFACGFVGKAGGCSAMSVSM